MTTKSRRRLLICLVAAAFLLPSQYLALSTLNTRQRPLETVWIGRMDSSERVEAARNIQGYPVSYRKALLGRLSAADRAEFWRNHAETYMQEHPELSVGQRASVRSFIDASIEEAFKNVPAAVTKMNDAVKAITDHLSPTGFRYLLVDVGRPFTGSVSSSSLPLRIRLEAFVRTHFIVEAGGGNYCECNMGSANQCLAKQLCGYDSNCTLLTSGCGPAPFYIMTCDGKCSSRQDGEN